MNAAGERSSQAQNDVSGWPAERLVRRLFDLATGLLEASLAVLFGLLANALALSIADAAAMPAFAALVGTHSDDALAGFHLRRLLNGAKGVRMQLE